MKNILLSGVGGQGTVLASRVIAQVAMEKGLFARTAETIGMAQRGGCVVSHVRIGEGSPSSMIPLGGADVLIGFEPGEAVRCLPWLKPDGVVIVSDLAIQPVTGALSGVRFEGAPAVEFLKQHAAQVVVVDAERIFRETGSDKVLNVALLGAAMAAGALNTNRDEILHVLAARLPEKLLAINEKALLLGAESVGGTKA